ncbi:ImmA/IrrE family metallo-endopeptidase [Macrococcoides caseolyticum]|uniref:ImmA/IrrE family metallo-endopeptidase n=1 Tax=Macrococcoides caseolyticum TaxID=69966 RepID=UPI00105E417D|nr:ImmA/IrrE family metallo-endopeptidase [Macrococcus caseolyticus]TDM31348.1 ImmA/IrrE family metallo-endopeptidase [Macrococcus caseolyticus]
MIQDDNYKLKSIRSCSHRMQDGRELAEFIFENYFDEGIHSKVDVFNLCKEFEVNFLPINTENVDGVYISERFDNISQTMKKAFIGLKINNSNIRRLKFTLAHELCHHIKGFEKSNQITLNENSNIDIPYSKKEKFANDFASYLLIPYSELKKQVKQYDELDFISDQIITELANYFEVSKSAIIYRLKKMNYNVLDGNITTCKDVDSKIKLQYILGVYNHANKLFKLKFQKSNIIKIVVNDSRFENIDLSIQEMSEILYDIDYFKENEFEVSNDQKQIIGLYYMYNQLLDETRVPDQYLLLEYHSYLYLLSDDYINDFRRTDAKLSKSKVKTTVPNLIRQEMYLLSKDIENVCKNDELFLKFINSLIFIHQKITQIHPFTDGNGRISRLLNNWILQIKGYPYVYISLKDRDDYLDALSMADDFNYSPLMTLMIDSMYDRYNEYIINRL